MMPSIPILGENAATLSYIHLVAQGVWKRYLDRPGVKSTC